MRREREREGKGKRPSCQRPKSTRGWLISILPVIFPSPRVSDNNLSPRDSRSHLSPSSSPSLILRHPRFQRLVCRLFERQDCTLSLSVHRIIIRRGFVKRDEHANQYLFDTTCLRYETKERHNRVSFVYTDRQQSRIARKATFIFITASYTSHSRFSRAPLLFLHS